ncbi:hypothetical protein LOTGIDRAFT_158681 [Lottia gigantea]|uniref:MalT-like TPR region domain-containing protein n=1 Tax=Lottia gigantea TaxID=225164 RepID=V4A491_LOTGI|nr:hypothetical protein LOTGIDRAFT_158681 [Lottia gigantea]ESO98733.1 hypothetical protein LOTGIDRAFT_158681 [Lottia gigantea]
MYEDVILERCHGLPTFILDAAALIRDSQNAAPLSCDDLRNLLQDDARLSRIQEDPLATPNMTLARLIPCVPPELQQAVTDLSILSDGQFGLEAVEAVLGKSAPEAKHAVGVLCRNKVLSSVENTTLYHFTTPIGERLGSVMKKHIRYNDAARLRFVKYFGQILLKTNSDLYLPSQQSLYGYDEKSWTNLQTVLRQAIHCTDTTFDAFKQVALKADNIIINCFPRESVEFYEHLTGIAERCGSPRDVAALKAQLARALTVNNGTNLKHAMELFQEAEEVLKEDGPSSALICLMRDMAFNYFKNANYKEASRCCEEGIRLAQHVDTDNMDISRLLSTRSLAAINYNVLGQSEKAEAIILETLDLANEFSTSHSSIYVMLNTLGIIHEKFKKNDDEALRYFKASLHERRKYSKITPSELIVTLNSVGMQYSKREQLGKALKYLEEALSICKQCGINDDKAGLTYMHLGIVNMKLSRYELTCEQMQKAVQIYSVCSPTQRVHINLRAFISHCLILKAELGKAKDTLKECFNYSKSLIQQAPKYDYYLASLAHLITLSQDNLKVCKETLKRFEEESSRLLEQWEDSDARIEVTRSLLSSARLNIENIAHNQRIDVTPFIDIEKICFVCQTMTRSGVDMTEHWHSAQSKTANKAKFKCRLFQL